MHSLVLTSARPGDNNYYDAPPTGYFRTLVVTRIDSMHLPISAIIDHYSTSMTMTRYGAYKRYYTKSCIIKAPIIDRYILQVPVARDGLFEQDRSLESAKRSVRIKSQAGNISTLRNVFFSFYIKSIIKTLHLQKLIFIIFNTSMNI